MKTFDKSHRPSSEGHLCFTANLNSGFIGASSVC
jgi:hypothetical protein